MGQGDYVILRDLKFGWACDPDFADHGPAASGVFKTSHIRGHSLLQSPPWMRCITPFICVMNTLFIDFYQIIRLFIFAILWPYS